MIRNRGATRPRPEELIGAMQAAAEASNAPFLLLVDALNEAERPKAWREELPALLAEIANKPWIALGVSIRSNYRELVLPEESVPNVEEIEHSGFAGRDTEAVERFFAALGPPQTPQFALEFTNPLFLKLYCETMVDLGPSCIGDLHVTNVFQKYLELKARQIADRLDLDPHEWLVEDAVGKFVEELVREKQDSLAYDRSAEIVNGFAPRLQSWPNTLLGQLLTEGVLSADLAWRNDQREQVVRFTWFGVWIYFCQTPCFYRRTFIVKRRPALRSRPQSPCQTVRPTMVRTFCPHAPARPFHALVDQDLAGGRRRSRSRWP